MSIIFLINMNLTIEYFCIEELEGFPSLTFVLLKLYKPLSYMSFMDQFIELQTQTEANFLQILLLSMHIGLLLAVRFSNLVSLLSHLQIMKKSL